MQNNICSDMFWYGDMHVFQQKNENFKNCILKK